MAEAVNFALKSWIDIGKIAKSCLCRGDSVKINMEDFLSNLKRRSRSPNSTSSHKDLSNKLTAIKRASGCNLNL